MYNNSHLSVLVHEQAKHYGEREVLVYKDFGGAEWKSLSWNGFAKDVKTVSNAFVSLGIEVQENIGIFSQNARQFFTCDFGAWGVRAVTIPFYATSSEQQIQYMINDAKVRILFVGEQEQYDKAQRVTQHCPTLATIIVFDARVDLNGATNAMHFDDFLRLGDDASLQTEVDKRTSEACYDDIANILYTSGTTGDSKGVMLSHAQWRAALDANDECVTLSEDDRLMNFLPYAHIFERGFAILSLTEGCTVIVNSDPREVQKSMRETHPTCMSAVPRFWEKIYAGVKEKIDSASAMQRRVFKTALTIGRKHNVEHLAAGKKPPLWLRMEYEIVNKTLFSLIRKELGLEKPNIFPTAGAAVSEHVEEFAHTIGLNMVVGYGLTESLATVSCDRPDEGYTIGSVGKPISSIAIKISSEGEVMLKGPTITRGYYNRPELTAAAFDEEGYFHTGDVGYMKDGELFLTERIKDLFKTSNGKYIAPQMIESKLLVDKYIDQVAVIADQRKFVSALIVPVYHLLEEYANSRNIVFNSREELCDNPQIHEMLAARIDALQQQLASYEKIKRFTIMPEAFTMGKGELTNTLKLKRRVVGESYKTLIGKMYED